MDYLFKVIIAGDGGVGKTTLLKRLLNHDYNPQELTIGLDYGVFETEIQNDLVKLIIWDLGGQKQFRTIHDLYCKGAKGVILTHDLSRKDTLFNLYFWTQFIEEQLVKENENIVKILIGTKQDLGNETSEPYIEDFKKENKIDYSFITSAKQNMNILSTFKKFADLLYKEYVQK